MINIIAGFQFIEKAKLRVNGLANQGLRSPFHSVVRSRSITSGQNERLV